ncbi:MAG: ORF6N domain-containing protein [Bacteroidota bacterium]
MEEAKIQIITDENVVSRIFSIRGRSVMLDSDLAELYGVETKRINEQVKRNPERFPEDFMFQLSQDEYLNLKSQNATSSWGGRRSLPFAFTEYGVLMLSSVLNSPRAIQVNIQVMRVYSRIRQLLSTEQELRERLQQYEQKFSEHDEKINLILEYLRKYDQAKQEEREFKDRNRVGFKQEK